MKFVKLFLALFFVVSLTSCSFTENIYINEDGSGKFSMEMDGSQLMAMVPQDSLKSEKVIDTVFAFKQIIESKSDSISKLSSGDQARIKKLENYSMQMQMNPAEKKFFFSMFTDFKSVSELQDGMSAMNTIQDMNKQKSGDNPIAAIGGLGNNNSLLQYSFSKNKFTRKSTPMQAVIKKAENDSLQQAYKMIYESSTYIIKYHFPKKVKKVSNPKALYSEDRKSITIEYPFSEYMDNPEKLNFVVEFEK